MAPTRVFSLPPQVMVHPGPALASVLPVPSPVATLGREYGGLEVTLEVVGSVEEAAEHINTYGSGHTDCIVTEDGGSMGDGVVCCNSTPLCLPPLSPISAAVPLLCGQCLRLPQRQHQILRRLPVWAGGRGGDQHGTDPRTWASGHGWPDDITVGAPWRGPHCG